MVKVKKVPQRKCIACGERDTKSRLIRVVKNKEGQIFLDPTGKANGRGAYVCATEDCIKKAIKSKAFNRAFRLDVEDEVYDNLLNELKDIQK